MQAGDDLTPAPGQKQKKHKKHNDQGINKEGQGSAGHVGGDAGMDGSADDVGADDLSATLFVSQPEPAGSSKRVSLHARSSPWLQAVW
jgi:hypothetical protein